EEGTTNNTPANSFLQADPAKFVPVNADGSRAYGSFVSADAAGKLGRFLFYPEGLGDSASLSGAHFEFPAGASVSSPPGANPFQSSAGTFGRGSKDSAPLAAGVGAHTLNIDAVTPGNVATALGLPPGTPISLLFGNGAVSWLNGLLNGSGWSTLSLRPP